MQNKIEVIQDYIKKVEEIKAEFEKYKSDTDTISIKDSSMTIPTKEIEFKHLVYRYNPNLPLNNHLQEVVFKHGYFPSHRQILGYVELMKFFIKYLNEEIALLKENNTID